MGALQSAVQSLVSAFAATPPPAPGQAVPAGQAQPINQSSQQAYQTMFNWIGQATPMELKRLGFNDVNSARVALGGASPEEINGWLTTLANPLNRFDSFLEHNPVGQALSPIAQAGIGVSSTAGAHVGMTDPGPVNNPVTLTNAQNAVAPAAQTYVNQQGPATINTGSIAQYNAAVNAAYAKYNQDHDVKALQTTIAALGPSPGETYPAPTTPQVQPIGQTNVSVQNPLMTQAQWDAGHAKAVETYENGGTVPQLLSALVALGPNPSDPKSFEQTVNNAKANGVSVSPAVSSMFSPPPPSSAPPATSSTSTGSAPVVATALPTATSGSPQTNPTATGAGVAGAAGAGATAAGTTAPSSTGTTAPAAAAGGITAAGLQSLIPGLDNNTAALLAGLGAGGISSVLAAKMQADAATSAAANQEDAFNNALKQQQAQFDTTNSINKGIYDTQQDQIKPFIQAGQNAVNQIPDLISGYKAPTYTPFTFDMNGPNADPSYSFRLDQGIKALQNSAAARGGLLSGNTMKGITDYAQGAASQEYQNAFNRYQTEYQNNFNNYQTQFGTKLNALQSLAGQGQTGVQQSNQSGNNYASNAQQAGQNYANAATSSLVGAAQAYGTGQTNAANANASGTVGVSNSLINSLNSYYQNQNSNALVNALLARS